MDGGAPQLLAEVSGKALRAPDASDVSRNDTLLGGDQQARATHKLEAHGERGVPV